MSQTCAIAVSLLLACGVVLATDSFKSNAESIFHRLRRQTPGSNAAEVKCALPGTIQNGKYFLDPKRCPPDVCVLAPGSLIPSGWDIFYECDPGYMYFSGASTSICVEGRWSPELPEACIACGSSTEYGTITPLISNGKNASVGSFPWHAGLYNPQEVNGELTWVQKCGGSLVSAQFVVTAAHCVVVGNQLRRKEDFRIALGKLYRSWDQHEDHAQKRNVKSITFQQRDYNKATFYFDIALVMMDKKVEFGTFVMPVCTGNPFDSKYLLKNKLFVAGWGLTESREPSDLLQYTDVTLLPRDDCELRIPISYFLLEKLCTLKNGDSDVVVREGDSGGGLTVVYNGHHYIIGIASSNLNKVTLFTDINFSIHKAWMEIEINSKKTIAEKPGTTEITVNVVIKQTTESDEACPKSETMFKHKAACKGEVVFEDTFDGPLSDNWKHWVYIASNGYNFKMNVFDKAPGFTSAGSLVIRPTVFNDTFVEQGTLALKGCTYGKDSPYCLRTASLDVTLPPVHTSWLHSYSSINFRYGRVEIRAKLPVGDWLTPEIWLKSVNDFYGDLGASGIIQILTRGNSDLICAGEDLGNGRVEFWVSFGPKGNFRRKKYFLKNISGDWYDKYHNFTITWLPDSLTFEVDDEIVGEMAARAGKTLCEVWEFSKDDCLTYSKGTSFAPFDRDFSMNVGVLAGNEGYFPDSCINKGKPKPWKNGDPKGLLNFWQDRKNWLPSWTKEGSSLYIDYIRITAV